VVVVVGGTVVAVVLLDDEDDPEAVVVLVVLLGSERGVLVGAGAVERLVPSVATCSSRRGPCLGVSPLDTPTANNAATAAPRTAPTASRNGTPLWSSTPYLYLLDPFGSSWVQEARTSRMNIRETTKPPETGGFGEIESG
jgi:hypothetical protein